MAAHVAEGEDREPGQYFRTHQAISTKKSRERTILRQAAPFRPNSAGSSIASGTLAAATTTEDRKRARSWPLVTNICEPRTEFIPSMGNVTSMMFRRGMASAYFAPRARGISQGAEIQSRIAASSMSPVVTAKDQNSIWLAVFTPAWRSAHISGNSVSDTGSPASAMALIILSAAR